MLAQSTDSGQLIAAAVIKLFHGMKLQVQDLRGVGIQVQLLDGNAHQDSVGPRKRSIKDMLQDQGSGAQSETRGLCPRVVSLFILLSWSVTSAEIVIVAIADNNIQQEKTSATASSSSFSPQHLASPEPVPGTSRGLPSCRQTPRHSRARLNCSIEVPSPSQVRIRSRRVWL